MTNNEFKQLRLRIEARNLFDKSMPPIDKKIGIFGYRPNNGLPSKYGDDIKNKEYQKMKDAIKFYIVENDVTEVYTGFSNGTEIAVAYAVDELKRMGYPVKLNMVQVFKGYNETGKNKIHYDELSKKADTFKLISDGGFDKKAFIDFNTYLIDNSDICVFFINTTDIDKNIPTIRIGIQESTKKNKNIVYFDYNTLKRA